MADDQQQAVSFAELSGLGIRFTRRWISELCKAGEFPKPLRLGRYRVFWLRSEVEAWLADKQAARNMPVAASQEGARPALARTPSNAPPKPVGSVRAAPVPRRSIGGRP